MLLSIVNQSAQTKRLNKNILTHLICLHTWVPLWETCYNIILRIDFVSFNYHYHGKILNFIIQNLHHKMKFYSEFFS